MRIVLSIAFMLSLYGCAGWNPQSQITDMQKAVLAQAVAALDSNGITQTQTSGAVINPGIRVSAGIEYYATARLEGVSGSVMSALQGQTGDVNKDVLDVLRSSRESDDRKWDMLAAYLERQRGEVSTNGVAP